MPLHPGRSREVINKNTDKLIAEGYDPKQAYAIANDNAKKYGPPESPHKTKRIKTRR